MRVQTESSHCVSSLTSLVLPQGWLAFQTVIFAAGVSLLEGVNGPVKYMQATAAERRAHAA